MSTSAHVDLFAADETGTRFVPSNSVQWGFTNRRKNLLPQSHTVNILTGGIITSSAPLFDQRLQVNHSFRNTTDGSMYSQFNGASSDAIRVLPRP